MHRGLTREARVDRLVEELVEDVGGGIDPDEVTAAVRAEYDRLCATSRVTDFVPILAGRRVREDLRRRYGRGRIAGGPTAGRLRRMQRAVADEPGGTAP